jgi:membrane protease subunit (stomatin/prohibitin family)
MIRKFFNLSTGGETPFHCEVYFINKTEQMAIKWGTDSKVEYVEPTYNFPIQIGASGEMSLRADDARKLLIKIVGTEKVLSQQTLTQKFRAFLMTRFKTYLANYMRECKINIFTIAL